MRLIQYIPTTQSLAPAFGVASRSPWTGFESEIDRLLASALPNLGCAASSGTSFPVDLYEDKDNTYLRADLPGVSRDAITIEVAEGCLTIGASRKQKTGESEESFSYNRSVAIPNSVQADKASAAYENGVLTVTLPKSEALKPRKIAVS